MSTNAPWWVLYIVVPIIILGILAAIIYWISGAIRAGRTMAKGMRGGNFQVNPAEPDTGPWAQAVALGAPLPVYRSETWNGLGILKDEAPLVRRGLAKFWGVNTKWDWESAVANMLDGDFGEPADELVVQIRRELLRQQGQVSHEQWRAAVDSWARQHGVKDQEIGNMLALTKQVQMYEDGLARENLLPGPITSLLAYDYGRGVAITRWGRGLGFTQDEGVKDRVRRAVGGVNQHYGSWAEYGAAYFIGRCMGLDEDTPGQAFAEAVETLRELLNNPESPWVKLPWPTSAPA